MNNRIFRQLPTFSKLAKRRTFLICEKKHCEEGYYTHVGKPQIEQLTQAIAVVEYLMQQDVNVLAWVFGPVREGDADDV